MAIMNKMRENTHIILFGLLVMFILSMTIGGLVGGADITHLFGRKADTIVSINGEDIAYKQYSDYYQQQIEAYQQQYQRYPEGIELQNLEDQIWESLIREILIRQKTEEMGIVATKKEIAYYILDNPHPFLLQNPNFADEQGKFDMKKYQAALTDPRNSNYWSFVENYLANTIPFNKLQQEVVSSVFVTDEEVKQDFINRNQKIKVKYVLFDQNKLNVDELEIRKQDIEKYYNENKETYIEEEKRKIQFVKFDLVPTESDTDEVKYLAETILDSLRLGVEFAKMAETYSEDAVTANKGGDLGFLEKGMKDEALESAAFTANVGDVVGPVFTKNGMHILKITDKKKEDGKDKVQVSHILLEIKPSRSTQEALRDDADYFIEIASEEGFNTAAVNEKLKSDTTGFFAKTGFIPQLGMQRKIAENIFHSKIGKITRPYFIENQGFAVCQLLEIQKERTKPLADVESIIRNILVREKKKEMAAEVAQKFREKISTPEQFEQLTAQDSLQIQESEFFALSGYIRNVGKDINFNGAAFALEQNEISQVVKGTRCSYIIQLLEKQSFDESTFELQKENLKNSLMEEKQRRAYTNWYTNLKENAKIKDYRYLFL